MYKHKETGLACVAGGICARVYCFIAFAAEPRRVLCFVCAAATEEWVQVNFKSRLPQVLGILNSPQPGLREFLIGWEAIKHQSNDNWHLYFRPRER